MVEQLLWKKICFFWGQGHPKVSVANPYIDPPVPMKMAKGKSMYSKSLGTINGYFMVYLSFFYRYLEGQMLYVTRHITHFLDHPASLKSISKALSFSSSGSCPKSVFELITLTFLGTTERCQGKQLQQPWTTDLFMIVLAGKSSSSQSPAWLLGFFLRFLIDQAKLCHSVAD